VDVGTRFGRIALAAILSVLYIRQAAAQPPLPDAAERRIALEKLSVLGAVLYIGAHPDDENTALLATLAKGRRLRTGYLSLTRGDGGQNLVGTEQGDALGVLRSEELLAARRVDGAEQLFTRAVDFGYSKTPQETLAIWGHDEILADVVWVLRTFRPDVVITRFPENGDGGHGHHTASATLAHEAFLAAGDPSRFPEQLAYTTVWQPRRLLWNAWRRPDAPPQVTPTPGRLVIALGAWDPLLGQAYTEVAATARTFHKSQGFGSAPRRGALPNEFELVAGAPAKIDLLEGIDTSWRRVAGTGKVAAALAAALAAHSDTAPERAVPDLVAALGALDKLKADPWLAVKRTEIVRAIQACTGLWLEATAAEPVITPGATVKVTTAAINRSPLAMSLVRVTPPFAGAAVERAVDLASNQPVTTEVGVAVPAGTPYSQPFWLDAARPTGRYTVADRRMVGLAKAPAPLVVRFTVALAGREIDIDVPVENRVTDPVEGERTRDVAVAPPVTASFEAPVLYFPNAMPRPVRLVVRAEQADVVARLALEAPAGFTITPADAEVRLGKTGQEQTLVFTVTAPRQEAAGDLRVRLVSPRDEPARTAVLVDHSHIPPQLLLPPAAVRAVRLDAKVPVRRVGYVNGPGDEVAGVLRQLGIEVTVLDEAALAGADLASFDAVVTGVRAYNTRADLVAAQPRLLSYVAQGGTLVVQYVTDRGLLTDSLGPYPFTVSRDRVTDETAAVDFLLPDHFALTRPNKLSSMDFADWIQERGLNFASRWDAAYSAPVAMADPGEKPSSGALLVATHGKGTFVYTGIAFFRQLPAGKPGAVRLFLNLLGGGR
jgi:LmbE family N-acetylglucosaminyl deacetylase